VLFGKWGSTESRSTARNLLIESDILGILDGKALAKAAACAPTGRYTWNISGVA
jgi:hypothetical protein